MSRIEDVIGVRHDFIIWTLTGVQRPVEAAETYWGNSLKERR